MGSQIKKLGKQQANVHLSIINQSAAPAQGLENPKVRVFYQIKAKELEDISVVAVSNDCPNSPASAVQLKSDTFHTDVSCDGTVIYPGGETDYKKQIDLTISLGKSGGSLWDSFGGIFNDKSLEITRVCLYDGDELIWESNS